ncbi:MAG TPA: hypothetical protein VFI25_19205 [Planctomycetota bacterium]|nr:hypothetical protein [Planctomycetota bacterium]
MKRWIVPAFFAAALLVPRAGAQSCPFNVVFSSSGAACTQSGALNPTVAGSYANGAAGCSVTFVLTAPPFCCNTFVTGRFLVIGDVSLMVPVPGGCTLLVYPDLVLPVPASPTSLTFPLPPDPALVGLLVFVQGVVVRFTTIGMTTDLDFTSRLHVLFQ